MDEEAVAAMFSSMTATIAGLSEVVAKQGETLAVIKAQSDAQRAMLKAMVMCHQDSLALQKAWGRLLSEMATDGVLDKTGRRIPSDSDRFVIEELGHLNEFFRVFHSPAPE